MSATPWVLGTGVLAAAGVGYWVYRRQHPSVAATPATFHTVSDTTATSPHTTPTGAAAPVSSAQLARDKTAIDSLTTQRHLIETQAGKTESALRAQLAKANQNGAKSAQQLHEADATIRALSARLSAQTRSLDAVIARLAQEEKAAAAKEARYAQAAQTATAQTAHDTQLVTAASSRATYYLQVANRAEASRKQLEAQAGTQSARYRQVLAEVSQARTQVQQATDAAAQAREKVQAEAAKAREAQSQAQKASQAKQSIHSRLEKAKTESAQQQSTLNKLTLTLAQHQAQVFAQQQYASAFMQADLLPAGAQRTAAIAKVKQEMQALASRFTPIFYSNDENAKTTAQIGQQVLHQLVHP